MAKQHKKYHVYYCSAPTGFGWELEYDRISEFEDFVNEMRREPTAEVSVWDCELGDFIFWKRAMRYYPDIDMLHHVMRDLRTTTRKMKLQEA